MDSETKIRHGKLSVSGSQLESDRLIAFIADLSGVLVAATVQESWWNQTNLGINERYQTGSGTLTQGNLSAPANHRRMPKVRMIFGTNPATIIPRNLFCLCAVLCIHAAASLPTTSSVQQGELGGVQVGIPSAHAASETGRTARTRAGNGRVVTTQSARWDRCNDPSIMYSFELQLAVTRATPRRIKSKE
ncbi:hypothetical protein DFH09DRAFT_1097502 [Mycena vulgaris]|nr:hypothetical protein DFH09DRAFT_1097502 [Mycena vulgaris]